MSLLNVSNLSFHYPSQAGPLFAQVSFEVNPGDHIGIVGPNGAGKTTLLRILAGQLDPHAGAVAKRQHLRVSYVPQESPAPPENRLYDYVLTADAALAGLHREISGLERRLDCADEAIRYASLLDSFNTQGGYGFQAEAETVLDGLGLGPVERSLPMARLSSGQRARAELARLLLAPTDLLLIDEPTNHLDIAAREWLEDYLSHFPAPYLVVSHDRAFLVNAVNRIFDLRRQTLVVYEGNYEFYLEQRTLRETQAWEQYSAQRRRAAAARQAAERRMVLSRRVAKPPRGARRNNDFYARKAAKVARTARILRSRVAREPVVRKPWVEDPIPPLRFPGVARTRAEVLRVENLSKSYGDKLLFRGLSFQVRAGTRWAILGPNGCGKSTLIRILLGYEKADEGTVTLSARVRPGYYAQEGENLDAAKSPVELCLEVNSNETWVRTILGCLRLRGENAERPIQAMSAGERAKVALARLLSSGPNFLLLDEVTNHLDIEAREALENTLARFPGTILFVSHDRYLTSKLADEILDLSADRGDC
jgi:ATP-binding cassette subfamily F protein 3